MLDVTIISLHMNFAETIYKGEKKLGKILFGIKPDIVHSQCFRSTLLLAIINGTWKTCATIHCYPHKDFIYEYGIMLGNVMARLYINALRNIDLPIACSKSISNELMTKYSLRTLAVCNGVEKQKSKEIDFSLYKNNSKQLVFVCVSCFNKRKNQEGLLLSAKKLLETNKIAIIFLGDGKYREKCENLKIANTYYLGNVENVGDYYAVADGIISASKAEGLPMAVIEALMMGVPRYIISDIPPHREIEEMFPDLIKIVNYNNELNENDIDNDAEVYDRKEIMKLASERISAKIMARKYMKIYDGVK